MRIRWNFSETWARGIFAIKQPKIQPQKGAINSALKGILTLNPFGKSVKLPKSLPSDEFMTFKYPKRKLLDQILKHL